MSEAPLLEVKNLRLSVRTDEGLAQILDHVELALPRGQILGVVGESGCGKSTLARAILGIVPKTATIESGEIRLEGENLLALSDREMTRARARPPHRLHSAGPLSGAEPGIQDRLPAASPRCAGTRPPHVAHRAGAPRAISCRCCAACRSPSPRPCSSAIRTSSPAASASA